MKLILALAFLSTQALAKLQKDDWELSSGSLTYHVSYPLKTVKGTSKNVKGKGHCNSGQCEFLIAVPVKSFESGDGNRDNHMLEATKGALHPMAIVKAKFKDEISKNILDANLEISFAGKTHSYEHVKIQTQTGPTASVVQGTIPLMLSHFNIERPSLLGIRVDDSAPVNFELTWR